MPEPVSLGPLLVSIRILAFAVSLTVAMWVGSRLAVRLGLDASRTRLMVGGSVLAGLVAARLVYVALYWDIYASVPWTALYLWQPGYLPVAGLVAGALYLLYRLRLLRGGQRLRCLRAASGGIATGAVLLAASLLAMSPLSHGTALRAGDKVPDFSLIDLSGKPVALSDLAGKGIVLNFWATWCPPCRREMPLLESAWNEYRDRNVVIVGVALGQSRDTVRPFTDSMGVSYPIWTDPDPGANNGDDSNEVFDWFDSRGLPTTIFIRPDGVIDQAHLGQLTRGLLLQEIPRLIP